MVKHTLYHCLSRLIKMGYAMVFFLFGWNVSAQVNDEIGIQSDNDVYFFLYQDKYYTNGTYFHYRHALQPHHFNFLKGDSTVKMLYHLRLGQAIFNPQSAFIRNLKKIDRPFAGWLFGEVGLNSYSKKEHLISFNLQFGTIGPASLAENFQVWYHQTFGFDKPVGWETQIQNEWGINLKIQYDQLLLRSKQEGNDLILQTNALLGNTFTKVETGFLYRTGILEKLYQSFSTQSRASTLPTLLKKEFFFFVKPFLGWVIYDATFQGGVWNTDSLFTFQPTAWVWNLETGFAFAGKKSDFQFLFHFNTPETSQMRWTNYGILKFSQRF